MTSQEIPLGDSAYTLYTSSEQRCSYLPDQNSRMLFFDPSAQMDTLLYQWLIGQGFRRSGDFVYRPACRACSRCLPIRISVQRFRPNRSQRRCWNRNRPDLTVSAQPMQFDDEQYALFQRYIDSRHPDGGMHDMTPQRFVDFIGTAWGETINYEFRLDGRLVAVAATDLLPESLSSIYTYFDPDLGERGLGSFGLLWQIEQARELGLEWVYPGYWIEGCRKMSYKRSYHPAEVRRAYSWVAI